ncbi:MAG TPA: hypothetical protein VNS50_08215, partial [Ginsengibacter sp.]|nr:hypothetical protein [Ginsengibacter sp.]
DGVLNTYSDNDNNDIDEKDAKKNNNPAENLSIERNDTLLAIERRQTLRAEDTIFFQVGKLSAKRNYRFVFTPNKIYESGLQPYLEDNYLNTKTDLHLTDTTRVSFFTDGTTGSTAFNRFRVVFDAAEGILPVTFTNVNAYTKNWEIAVEWQVENETGIKYYEVEKSTDETYFTSVVEVTAKNTAQDSKYTWTDVQPSTGYNYYRVKSVDNSGAIRYSKVVKILMTKLAQGIHVYPNPLVNNTIQLEFVSMPAGKYEIQLINKLGQVIESKEIQHTGNGSGTEAVPIKAFAPHGVYRLEIIKPGGDKINSSIIY